MHKSLLSKLGKSPGRRFRKSNSPTAKRSRYQRITPGASIEWLELHQALLYLGQTFAIVPVIARAAEETTTNYVNLAMTHPAIAKDAYRLAEARRLSKLAKKLRATFSKESSAPILAQLERMWLEMYVCKAIDAFEFFLTALLRRAIKKNPRAIAKSKIPMEVLMQCKDINEATANVIDRQVYRASFGGLKSIADYLKAKFKVQIDRKGSNYLRMLELVEIRHLIVHNSSKVTARFIKNTRQFDLEVGKQFVVTKSLVVEALTVVADIADEIDDLLRTQGVT